MCVCVYVRLVSGRLAWFVRTECVSVLCIWSLVAVVARWPGAGAGTGVGLAVESADVSIAGESESLEVPVTVSPSAAAVSDSFKEHLFPSTLPPLNEPVPADWQVCHAHNHTHTHTHTQSHTHIHSCLYILAGKHTRVHALLNTPPAVDWHSP
jgi:hypothetical protein